jgi:flavin reductase (DIM6/NTAB) family NADH-FMN oxidoreductase RutF
MKRQLEPQPALFPCPIVLVSSIDERGGPNLITLAWAANICSEPPLIGISIRTYRYSYHLIKECGEFVVNIPTEDLIRKVDWCGVNSGSAHNKFQEASLTPEKALLVKPPLVAECPVNIECKLKQTVPLGVHELFIGQVLTVHVEEEYLNEKGKPDPLKVKPFVWAPGQFYYGLRQEILGYYGFTKAEK